MRQSSTISLLGLGVAIFLGLAALGYLLGQAAVEVKEYERSVTAKGLSEREFPADIVIWPVAFAVTGNDLGAVYQELDATSQRVRTFLEQAGIASDAYQNPVEYLFTRLNEVKPEMIEESTRNAREVASKFAEDSDSRLGKIRRASQGRFSIEPRDTNNPHIKKVRVVSTVEYYLSD